MQGLVLVSSKLKFSLLDEMPAVLVYNKIYLGVISWCILQ